MKPDKDDILFTPSPVKYSAKDISIKSPSWKIGKTKRVLTHAIQKTPGSGKYEYKSFIGEGPKYSFYPKLVKTNEKKKKYKRFNVPGPGSYNIINNNQGLKYTMGYKREKKIKILKSPSVGSYNLRKSSDFKAPASRFGKEKRENLNLNKTALEYPGPGHYSFSSEKTSSSSPKWSFGPNDRNIKKKSKKNEDNDYQVPGPGYYKIQGYMGKEGNHYSFAKDKYNHSDAFDELISKNTINYPTPTTYNRAYYKYLSDTPKWSISKLSRKNIPSDKFKISSPGPERYNPDFKQNSKYKKYPVWSFNQTSRDEEQNDKGKTKVRFSTPPPGYYSVKNGMIPQGLKYSIYGNNKKEKINESPGPGAYDIKFDGKQSEPTFSFGKENNKNNIKKIKKIIIDNTPGPGSYNIKDNDNSKKFSFSPIVVNKKFFNLKRSFVPGPGHYKIPASFDYISNLTREKGYFDPNFKYI